MATLSRAPDRDHVPTLAGAASGAEGVPGFDGDHLVGKFFPPAVTIASVSRCGESSIVEEPGIGFTDAIVPDLLLTGVQSIGKPVLGAFDGRVGRGEGAFHARAMAFRLESCGIKSQECGWRHRSVRAMRGVRFSPRSRVLARRR